MHNKLVPALINLGARRELCKSPEPGGFLKLDCIKLLGESRCSIGYFYAVYVFMQNIPPLRHYSRLCSGHRSRSRSRFAVARNP